MDNLENYSKEKGDKKLNAGYIEIIQAMKRLGFNVVDINEGDQLHHRSARHHITIVLETDDEN